MNPTTTLLTADDLAARWQVSKAHVYRLGREGRIPVVLIGRYMRFRLTSIQEWETAQEADRGSLASSPASGQTPRAHAKAAADV